MKIKLSKKNGQVAEVETESTSPKWTQHFKCCAFTYFATQPFLYYSHEP